MTSKGRKFGGYVAILFAVILLFGMVPAVYMFNLVFPESLGESMYGESSLDLLTLSDLVSMYRPFVFVFFGVVASFALSLGALGWHLLKIESGEKVSKKLVILSCSLLGIIIACGAVGFFIFNV